MECLVIHVRVYRGLRAERDLVLFLSVLEYVDFPGKVNCFFFPLCPVRLLARAHIATHLWEQSHPFAAR